jgi:ABC-2 type transport system ATP-binding protein
MKIQVKELTKQYGAQKAIDSISFDVGTGEIVGFLGRNGAGKTTTMKIITCFTEPTSGTVEVDDLNIFDHALQIRQKIGYLPEHNPLYLDMYVHEYLSFVGELYKIPRRDLKQRVASVIEMTGLQREQHKKLGMLSKGYRQRAGLAQALIHDPEILILDEPTTGLDPVQIVEIRNLIREIGKSKTVIFSTHILSEVEAIADRVIIIDLGQIIADSPLSDLMAQYNPGNVLQVKFQRQGFELGALQRHPGVLNIRSTGDRSIELECSDGPDPRPALYEASIQQANPIDLLAVKAMAFEDIFRELTGNSANRVKPSAK